MIPTVIYGAGGLGRVVRDILAVAGRYTPVAFLDSDRARHGTQVDGLPVIGGVQAWRDLQRRGWRCVVVALGDNAARVELAGVLEERGAQLVSAIHPLASVAASAILGRHVIIGPRAVVCVNATVGAHTVLLSGAIVEHDSTLGRGVRLDPAVRLAGNVTIEAGASVGVGACVIPGRCVGAGANVAPGAVVIRDVPAGAAVGGAPACTTTAAAIAVAEEQPPHQPHVADAQSD